MQICLQQMSSKSTNNGVKLLGSVLHINPIMGEAFRYEILLSTSNLSAGMLRPYGYFTDICGFSFSKLD